MKEDTLHQHRSSRAPTIRAEEEFWTNACGEQLVLVLLYAHEYLSDKLLEEHHRYTLVFKVVLHDDNLARALLCKILLVNRATLDRGMCGQKGENTACVPSILSSRMGASGMPWK